MTKLTSLKQLQRNFINDCLTEKLTDENCLMAKDIDTASISAQGLMGIYRHSAIANITQALALTYPVMNKLVGSDFFQATCRQFIFLHWPQSGNMDDYGEEFPHFLSKFKHTKSLVYLSDVARLEWAFHQSTLANDAGITDWSSLAQTEDILQLQFTLAPSVKLIHSIFTIDKIWQENQDNALQYVEGDVLDIEKINNTFLVLFRKGLKTVIMTVSEGEFVFLQAFKSEQVFEQAIIMATAKQADISIDHCLKKFIELGVINGFI